MDSKILAQKIAGLVQEVKALNVQVLDLRGLSSFTDFFVICSGTSDRQIRSIADRVVLELKKESIRPLSEEGYEQGDWVLVDYADVVLHVFSETARTHYDLEGFWKRAPYLQEKKKKAKKEASKSKRTGKKKSAPPKKSSSSKTSQKKKKK